MWPFKHIDTDKVCNSTFLQRWCEKSNSHHHHYDHAKVNDITYQSRSSSRPCDFRKIAVFCPQHRHMPEDIIRWTNHRALWLFAQFVSQFATSMSSSIYYKSFAASSSSSGQTKLFYFILCPHNTQHCF